MKKPGLCFAASLLACAFIFVHPCNAQTGSGAALPGKHRGSVNAIVRDDKGRILSAAEDGFLGIWNNRAAEERFQLSSHGIRSMVLRPGKSELAIIESDGFGRYTISAWDYELKKNLFSRSFDDPVSYINYSASGSFLIASRIERREVLFIHSETGEVLDIPEELSEPMSFAATGRSERNMICYFSSGILSYWDLETRNDLQHFEVPPNIQGAVLFGNNRFLGGFDSRGLLVLDAVSGLVLARDDSIRQGSIFLVNNDSSGSSDPRGSAGSAQFYCLDTGFSTGGRTATIYRMEISISGRLTIINRRSVPSTITDLSCVSAGEGDDIVLGTGQGALWLMAGIGARIMDTGNPERIIDIAASPSALALVSEGGFFGAIPTDFSAIRQGGGITLENTGTLSSGAYTNISSDPAAASGFLLWQSGAGRSFPMIKSASQFILDKLTMRFPLRSATVMGNSSLFLDTAGTVSVLDRRNGAMRFSYSATGSVDAAFIDESTIILGRNAVTGNTPFMAVNTITGETVSLPYPALMGIRVYRGSSGTIYGATVSQSAGNLQTAIVRLDTSAPAQSKILVEYNGEDSSLTMAESGGNLAYTLGGGGAVIYRELPRSSRPELIPMERSPGLPEKITDGSRWFVVLDGEGCIAWHDNHTGKLLAVFRLYTDSWVLERGEETISGPLNFMRN